ncbi:MAG: lysophospholipase [Pirellulaceae bacterium]|nr:lysophospholipase [Pirellulaceae bacterium]
MKNLLYNPVATMTSHLYPSVQKFVLYCFSAFFPLLGMAQENSPEVEIPTPRFVRLDTKDGVNLRCVYYEAPLSEEVGKTAIPVMLLHGWEGHAGDFDGLASAMQKGGYAVLVPDLRGHGRSVKQVDRSGNERDITPDKMRATDFRAMVLDVHAAKKFLIKEHNAGKLNIELLTVVGAEMGAIIALNWAAHDLNVKDLPAFKRGKDIKGLVLLSPPQSFNGLSPGAAIRQPTVAKELSVMVLVGREERKSYEAARRIHRQFKAKRPKLPNDPDERYVKQDLFWDAIDTSLQGTELLNPQLPVNNLIAQFMRQRIVERREDLPKWEIRRYE